MDPVKRQENGSDMSQELINNDVVRSIEKAISDLEFGEVNITVHHSRVVKIEKVERIRLPGQVPAGGFAARGENQGGEQ